MRPSIASININFVLKAARQKNGKYEFVLFSEIIFYFIVTFLLMRRMIFVFKTISFKLDCHD